MVAILRAACVIPRSEAGGRRVFGADEDEFTVAAAAIELLTREPDRAPLTETVHLAGTFPPSVESWIPELIGRPITVVRHAPSRDGFLEAVRASSEEHLSARAVVAVDTPPTGAGAEFGAAGIAFLIGSGPGIELRALTGAVPALAPAPSIPGIGTPPLTSWAFELRSHLRNHSTPASAVETDGARGVEFHPSAPIEWRGDWDGGRGPTRPIDPIARAALGEGQLASVSEGAYVPRPRYLENLPSRWRFIAERCGSCHAVTFPVRGRCRGCGSSDRLERIGLPLDGGRVLASTVIARGGQPTEFDAQVEATGPYGVVLVELAPSARVTLQVTDAAPGAPHIGDRIDTRLRRLYAMEGEWRYGRKAIPAETSAG